MGKTVKTGFRGQGSGLRHIALTFMMVAGIVFQGAVISWAQSSVNPDMLTSKILPKQVRWGCLVCHGDPKLARVTKEGDYPLYVDPEVIGNSVHARIACLDCHQDFSYSGHPPEIPKDFRKTAGLACRKCHRYQRFLYDKSIHYERATKGKMEGPTCGSCHGNHGIQFLSKERTDPEYKKKFRAESGKEMCGKCHPERYKSYNDYYHGRAYKMKAVDAPACWDCHANHRVLPAKDRLSTVNEDKLPETCNRCHLQATKRFTQYAPMMHGFDKRLANNPVIKLVNRFLPKAEDDRKEEPSLLGKVFARIGRFFEGLFPDSLRPRKEDSA